VAQFGSSGGGDQAHCRVRTEEELDVICPKQKQSKARTRKRKANWRLARPNLSRCPSCRELKEPHVACRKCGYYNGRLVIRIEDKKQRRR